MKPPRAWALKIWETFRIAKSAVIVADLPAAGTEPALLAGVTVVERLQGRGIRRIGSPKRGFRYKSQNGGGVSKAEQKLIRALVVPAAWTDAFVDTSPASAVQAIGKDRAGRWQYPYSETQTG